MKDKFIFVFICILSLVFSFVLFLIDVDVNYKLKIQELIFFLNVALAFAVIRGMYKTLININTVFILLYIIFIGCRPLFDLFGIDNILYFNFYINESVDTSIIVRTLLNINIAFLSYIVGVIFYNSFCRTLKSDFSTPIGKISEEFCWKLVLIGGIVKAYWSLQMLLAIIQNGYLALYTGELDLQHKSIVFNILSGLFDVGLYFLIILRRKVDKKILFVAFIYMILAFSSGQRGPGMLFFLFVMFLYVYIKKLRINFIKLGLVFVGFVFLLSFIGWFRGAQDVNFKFSVIHFLWGQGISMLVLTEAIRWDNIIDYSFMDLFGTIKYIFEYYVYKFSGESFPYSTIEIPIHYKYYSGYISNISNPILYDLGFGIGGSYIAEFYSIGKEFFQLFGGIFVALLLNFIFDVFRAKSGFWKFYAFHSLPFLLYIPRDNMMDFLTQDWWVLISYMLVVLFIKYIYNGKTCFYINSRI